MDRRHAENAFAGELVGGDLQDHRHRLEHEHATHHDQDDFLAAFKAKQLPEGDFVCVVRFQGPKANGMPELHSLTPSLSSILDQGRKVALVSDGRMSGASGKVPCAIHLSPEALGGGPIGKLCDGDVVRLCAEEGVLNALVDADEWDARVVAELPPGRADANAHGLGRELFGGMRRNVLSAEQGACTWL